MTELTDTRARLISAALTSSGLLQTVSDRINLAIQEGKVPIAQAQEHRKILLMQAGETMAKGLEGAFEQLAKEGYEIVKKETEDGEDTGVAA